MGRAKPGMEDDQPIANAFKMPSFISSVEEGRVKFASNLPMETSRTEGKVERTVGDLNGCVTRSNPLLSLDGGQGESEEKDAEGNNNNNCNGGGERRRRASAVEILRRNFGVSKSPSLRFNSSRMQCGSEHEDQPGDADSDVSHGGESESGHCGKSERYAGEAETENEPTSSELTTADARVAQRHRARDGDSKAVSIDESSGSREHVYCTVYCIASDDVTKGCHDTVAADAPDMDLESAHDAGSGPEPALYSLDDLVDPFGDICQLYRGQAGAEGAVESCRVCLEDKPIAPLPCCRKAVCDECLKAYVSSQVGGRGAMQGQSAAGLSVLQQH